MRQGPVALLRRLGLLPEIRHLSSFDPVDRQIDVLRELRPQTFSAYAISLELIGSARRRPTACACWIVPLEERATLTSAPATESETRSPP